MNYYLLIFAVFVMGIYAHKMHVKNYHICTSNQKKECAASKRNVSKWVVVASIVALTFAGVIIIMVSQNDAVRSATIVVFALLAFLMHCYDQIKPHIDTYRTIVEPTMNKFSKELDENILNFHICLTKFNKQIAPFSNDCTNQLMAIKILNSNELVSVENVGFGNKIIVRVNPLYRNKLKHYYKKWYKNLYHNVDLARLDDWLRSDCDDAQLKQHIDWKSLNEESDNILYQSNGSWWSQFSFYNGLVEMLFVALSFFSNQFNLCVLCASAAFSIVMMIIGYQETKDRNTLVTTAGFILTIVATCTSVIALLISMYSLLQNAT